MSELRKFWSLMVARSDARRSGRSLDMRLAMEYANTPLSARAVPTIFKYDALMPKNTIDTAMTTTRFT
eukprot:scaffold650494_cov37-Prasinocladus_malaysianus.AAC.1